MAVAALSLSDPTAELPSVKEASIREAAAVPAGRGTQALQRRAGLVQGWAISCGRSGREQTPVRPDTRAEVRQLNCRRSALLWRA
jgi:hypothetical protein